MGSSGPDSVYRIVIKKEYTFVEQDVYQAPGERAGPFLLTVKPRSFNYLYISFYDPVPFRRSLIYIYNNKCGNENQDQQLIQIWKPK